MPGRYSVEIKIATRHGHVSEETQAKIVSKLEKLPRLFDRLTAIEVTIDLERRDLPSIDVRVSAERGHEFLAAGQSEDLLVSTDTVVHKLEQQLRKHKERIQDRHRNPGHRQVEVSSDSGPGIE
jgi:putative sigma-54 modulation protein